MATNGTGRYKLQYLWGSSGGVLIWGGVRAANFVRDVNLGGGYNARHFRNARCLFFFLDPNTDLEGPPSIQSKNDPFEPYIKATLLKPI